MNDHSWRTLADPMPEVYSPEQRAAIVQELRTIAIAAREEANLYRVALDTRALLLITELSEFADRLMRRAAWYEHHIPTYE
ncbi:hypothetical protein FB384_004952 [Prauserella sediminis]|uniref:Uncharacterized protein n=1 Tax=Prauserella sediminis TaxID=577680 RepID=A0A839Y030_9PSEU|nr:hypothetical protein [Prauserella sediminis]MBB3665993.1 hypothetical protein [Prauserella sediminis]